MLLTTVLVFTEHCCAKHTTHAIADLLVFHTWELCWNCSAHCKTVFSMQQVSLLWF